MSAFPENLPRGEKLLWQGRPDWRRLAVRGFHMRGLAIYFAVMLAWCLLYRLHAQAPAAALTSTAVLTGVALVPLVLIALYAWMTARATTYTVTSRRVVIRLGLAVPMSVNLPFSKIDSAAAAIRPDGSGDVVLQLAEDAKLGYFLLWPHARPWRMKRPQPMLRALPQAAEVAQVLARGLAASAAVPVQPVVAPAPVAQKPARVPASHAAA